MRAYLLLSREESCLSDNTTNGGDFCQLKKVKLEAGEKADGWAFFYGDFFDHLITGGVYYVVIPGLFFTLDPRVRGDDKKGRG